MAKPPSAPNLDFTPVPSAVLHRNDLPDKNALNSWLVAVTEEGGNAAPLPACVVAAGGTAGEALGEGFDDLAVAGAAMAKPLALQSASIDASHGYLYRRASAPLPAPMKTSVPSRTQLVTFSSDAATGGADWPAAFDVRRAATTMLTQDSQEVRAIAKLQSLPVQRKELYSRAR